jgi:branched-chain amino acid transport system ATP-binding protein
VNGAVLTEGTPGEIAANQEVKAVYLGHGDEINTQVTPGVESTHV